MGYYFSLEAANLALHLTTPGARAPRASRGALENFLGSIRDGTPGERRGFVSRDHQWLSSMRDVAGAAFGSVPEVDYEALIDATTVEAILAPLRDHVGIYSLYALVVDDRSNPNLTVELEAAALFLAHCGRPVLVLIPDDGVRDRLELLDPLPPFAAAMARMQDWPGLLVWNAAGDTAFVPAANAQASVQEILWEIQKGGTLAESLFARPPQRKRILHLSDLHFGTDHAAQNLALLEAELFDIVRTVDRVVITGDLFDNPDVSSANAFRAFRLNLQRVAGTEPIVVPGNHDQRILGNVGQNFKHVANLNFVSHVTDETLGVTFLCFNSAEEGTFARGRVSEGQLTRVAAEWRNTMAMRPDTKGFLPVALVHHHPYSFETARRTWVQRTLAAIGLREETFLQMEEAPRFLEWCGRWKIPIVLHGHKHAARLIEDDVDLGNGRTANITAIGCGSSLGAEGCPVSYNVVSLDPQSRRWSAEFFESVGGGPFEPRLVTVARAAGS